MKLLIFLTSPTCSKCKTVYTWWDDFVVSNSWLDSMIEDTSVSLDLAKKYNIRSLPSFILLNEQGHKIGELLGNPARGALERMLTPFR